MTRIAAIFSGIIALAVAANAETKNTIVLSAPASLKASLAKTVVDRFTLELRFEDVVSGKPIPVDKISLIRSFNRENDKENNPENPSSDEASSVILPEPYKYLTTLEFLHPYRDESFRAPVGELNLTLPESRSSTDSLIIRMDGELASPSGFWWVRAEANGYYPAFRSLMTVVAPLVHDNRELCTSRTVKMYKPTRLITAENTTRTLDLAPGVTALLPPTERDFYVDIIPNEAAPSLLTSFYNRTFNNLCVALYPFDIPLSTPLQMRAEADITFPGMKKRQNMNYGKINMQTMKIAPVQSIPFENLPRPRGATKTRWVYDTEAAVTGIYLLQH